MEKNFKTDLQELLNVFPTTQTCLDRNKCVIAIMKYLLNYIYIKEFLYNHSGFTEALKTKCCEIIQDSYSTNELRDLCTRVLELI